MRQHLRFLFQKTLSYLPTRLPTGMTAFNAWLDSIVELAGPIADADSIKWVISNEVMRLSPGRDRVSKHQLVKLLRKYAANQLAAATVMELKAKQDAAAKAAKQAEDTAQQEKTTNENVSRLQNN